MNFGPRLGFTSTALVVCVAAVVTITACSPRPAAVNTTTMPALADRPTFDLPKLSGINIDGDPGDWRDCGFVVAAMTAESTRRVPAGQFDATLRLGWDERGLLMLADVTDPDIHESDSDLDFNFGSCVDITESDAKGVEIFRVFVSPGVDPKHPKMRVNWTDDRSKTLRVTPVSITATATKTANGYVLESLVPWNLLKIKPAVGSDMVLTIRVNRPDGLDGDHLAWSADLSKVNGKTKPLVRLAGAAGKPITTSLHCGYERANRAVLSLVTTTEAAGKVAEFRAGDSVVGSAQLTSDGRLAKAEIELPMPPVGKPYKAITAFIDSKPAAFGTLRNADDVRKDAGEDLDLVAEPAVFNTTTFPGIEFYSPVAADELLGRYVIHATFYDVDYNVVTCADRPGRYGAIVEVKPEFGKPFKKYLTLYRSVNELNYRPLDLKTALPFPSKFGIDPAVAQEQATATGDVIADELRKSRYRDGDFASYFAWLAETKAGVGDLPRRLGPAARETAWWYGLKKETGNLPAYRYLTSLPDPKKVDPKAKLPLILFLHGSGQRGHSLEAVKDNGIPRLLKYEKDWAFKDKFIVISPQCPSNETWNPLLLRDLLDEVCAKYPVDLDRVYLTGLSMGGFGTWELAEWYPERFAALAPVCGGGDPNDVARIADIPTWDFHGGVDPTVRIECSYEMVKALRDIHGRVRFTVYPERGHNSWVRAYDESALYEWLLAQKRGAPSQKPATTTGMQPADE